jgi:hypothetical protein
MSNRDLDIPDEAIEAALAAFFEHEGKWPNLWTEEDQRLFRLEMRAALAAALPYLKPVEIHGLD